MNIENKYPVMVFKKEYEGKTYYNLGLSKKDMNGNYINGYISCRFKKNIEVDDKKKIYIKNAWLDFYLKDKVTVPYVFINEFEYVEETIKKIKQESKKDFDKVIEEFSQEIQDEDLPF